VVTGEMRVVGMSVGAGGIDVSGTGGCWRREGQDKRTHR
jgi:hypothetical protein